MSQNYDQQPTGMSLCAAIAAPKSTLNAASIFSIPECCLMCSTERENGLFEFLNWYLQCCFDCVY